MKLLVQKAARKLMHIIICHCASKVGVYCKAESGPGNAVLGKSRSQALLVWLSACILGSLVLALI